MSSLVVFVMKSPSFALISRASHSGRMQFSEVVQINRNLFRHPPNQDLTTFEVACSTSQFTKRGICVTGVVCSEISVLVWLVFISLNSEKVKYVGNFSNWLHQTRIRAKYLNEALIACSYKKKIPYFYLYILLKWTRSITYQRYVVFSYKIYWYWIINILLQLMSAIAKSRG